MGNNDEHALLLGEIKGKLEMLDRKVDDVSDKLDAGHARLGKLEIRAATHGATAGGIIAVGLSLAIEKLKHGIGWS